MESIIGTSLGQYEIREKIGQGGMAHVFKAYQPGLDRFVAIKVLSPVLAAEAGFTERFRREAQSAARLQHPNILQVYDFGQHDKYFYIVMRYIENSTTLDDVMKQDNVSTNELLKYMIQVAEALSYAHDRGIIHRDIKPGNILIADKWALLTDFGLVKMARSSSDLTTTGVTMGTPSYMSPEQATGSKKVDHRTDIYALGIILYRMFTGSIPHKADTPLGIALRRNTEPIRSIREINPDVPESIEHVVVRALAIEPDTRYETATSFAKALRTAIADPNFRERTITDTMNEATVVSEVRIPDPREVKRNRLIVGGVIAAVVLVAVLGFFLFSGADETDSAAQITASAPTSVPVGGQDATPPTDTPVPPTDTPAPPTDTPTRAPGAPVVLAKTILDVRNGPGDAYDLVGKLREGATAEITGQDETGDWWQIVFLPAEDERGWVLADPDVTEATDANIVPIALAPPTPTSTFTPEPPTPTPTDTPLATATPTPSPTQPPAATSAVSIPPTATEPPLPEGEFVLLQPASLDQPTFGPTEFEWRWNGTLGEDQGFEVRLWLDGEPPGGVHNSVLDNREGRVQALGNNTYRLVADITDAPSVNRRSGDYNWTVILVQIDPEYKDLGIQAPPGRLRFALPGGGGGGGDGGGGGGGGGSGGPSF